MASPRPEVARVLIRPPNWLGDAILALPAMAAVRRHFPSAHLTIAGAPAVAAVFREETDVRPDRVLDLPASTRAASALLEGEAAEIGILFPNSFRSAWQFRRAGIRERWGYATPGRALLLTRRVRRANPRTPHQSDYYRGLVAGLGLTVDEALLPRVAATEPSRRRAEALLAARAEGEASARLVGLAPGAAYGQAKQWPPDRMAALVARLVREHDVTPVLVGAPHDRSAARAIESWLKSNAPEVNPRVIDLVGRTSVGALVGVTARCAVFVSNDSGAMHLAAALGRPVVALFGPTDERATGPLGDHDVITEAVFCRPCLLRDCPIDHRCMKRITVDRVFDTVVHRLASGSTGA
jgi:lipopolysaccharide heptosyltransferase II